MCEEDNRLPAWKPSSLYLPYIEQNGRMVVVCVLDIANITQIGLSYTVYNLHSIQSV